MPDVVGIVVVWLRPGDAGNIMSLMIALGLPHSVFPIRVIVEFIVVAGWVVYGHVLRLVPPGA